jgi:hypothetical protein
MIVGAVMYNSKVSVGWEVTALLDDRIDIARSSPLAWLDAARRSGTSGFGPLGAAVTAERFFESTGSKT